MVTTTWPAPNPRPVGELLREWRERRRISQLDLAIEAEVSARHLSFVETGRSRPTPAMILRLTEHLGVPLEHLGVPVQNPGVPVENLGVPVENLGVPHNDLADLEDGVAHGAEILVVLVDPASEPGEVRGRHGEGA